MPLPHLIITALIVFGWWSWASASPLLTRPPGAFLDSPGFLETAGWRYRYRRGNDFSEYRRRAIIPDRDETDGSGSRVNRPFIEMVRPESRRRGAWIDPPPPDR